MFDIIAILGRGTQRRWENGPWVLTEDLEMCDQRSAHLPVRVPVDDEHPYCMVGGAEMNLRAGIELIVQYKPKIVVCAYGGRSEYLIILDAPSESEVMSNHLVEVMNEMTMFGGVPDVIISKRQWGHPFPTNTRQELLNIFDMALERCLMTIAIVTVGVHVPRAATYVAKHFSVYPKYRHLSVVILESEEVLLAANRDKYCLRVEALRNSKAFARNWEREAVGISKIVRDVYRDAEKPPITASVP